MKKRRIKLLSIYTLIIAILGLTIAFATLSENLKINEVSVINQDKWRVYLIDSPTSSKVPWLQN